MQPLLFSLLLSLELSSALRCGSVLGRVSAAQHTARIPAVVSMAKGFGPPPPPPVKKAPSATKAKRDKAATAFDELKSSGAPEYMISVRTVGAAGPSDWMPVGGIAVPRSNSVDMAVSMAIYNNEEELLKGAKRSYPKLKVTDDAMEYGYRLKEFPEDEIKVAKKEDPKDDGPLGAIGAWFTALDSPLNKD